MMRSSSMQTFQSNLRGEARTINLENSKNISSA